MLQDDKTIITNQQSNFADGNQLVILLVAPSYDDLTEYTSKLLENFPQVGASTILCKLESPMTYSELLSQHSIDPLATEVALIYCGHGENDSLLGPGAHPSAPDYRTTHSSFFNESYMPIGPKFLLAFCSNAANGLGNSYHYMTNERTFIGFDEEIGFVLEEGPYAEWWRKIIHGLALAMLSAPDVNAMESSALRLYRDALSFFSSEGGRKLEWALIMRLYLRKQLDAINFIKT